VKKNNYRDNPKESSIETPPKLAKYLCQLVESSELALECPRTGLTVFDPAVGQGNLVKPFKEAGWNVWGSDIVSMEVGLKYGTYIQSRFEDLQWHSAWPIPDLIVCNPPFNSAPGRQLYPEVFLRHIQELFGCHIPVVMIVPMGMRLNQRAKSSRWRYMRDTWRITSVVSLPIDTFRKADGSPVLFHAEVLFFNLEGLNPHYFLPDGVLK
jgi:type I restriction enzyme M protein